ncbi:hypothetical protein DY000_02015867 [Brassica cretica]|uniref:Uncharacterized protein n=1 Tax=Brassica cretica TaxID=69181 RepID=A0ABQ7D9Z6_BRACR|nr:hypothetical protein DY000_02015867 [Brassica cretica]
MTRNMKWACHSLREIALKGRRECMDSCRMGACHSLRGELGRYVAAEPSRRKAEKEPVRAYTKLPSSSALAVTPDHGAQAQARQNAGTQVDTSVPCVLDASVQPTGSSTTPIFVEDKEKAAESIPPPPARKEIVMALRAPSAAPVVQPKGRKRKFIKGGDGESSQRGGSNLESGLRGKFVSLIDGIRSCGRGKWRRRSPELGRGDG